MTIKRALIFANIRSRDQSTRDELVNIMERRGIDHSSDDPQVIVSIGGDGTFLEAVRRYRHFGVPFVGVNTGSLGFLQEIDRSQLSYLAGSLVEGNYELETHPLLRATVHHAGGPVETYALNDVVVERRGTRTIRLQLTIDGFDCGKILGDGIIVATPLGSTAYASAAGGAVVHPSAEVYQLIPLNPHDSTIYKSIRTALVLARDSVVRIAMDPEKVREVRVVIDGAELDIDAMTHTVIEVSDETLPILKLGKTGYWRRLFTKILGMHEPEFGSEVPDAWD